MSEEHQQSYTDDENKDLTSTKTSPVILQVDNNNSEETESKLFNDNITEPDDPKPLPLQSISEHGYKKIEPVVDQNLSLTTHGTAGITSLDLPSKPLSWRSARARMRDTLEKYMKDASYLDTSSDVPVGQTHQTSGDVSKFCGLLSWMTYRNFDCYFGSVFFSVVLLVMSSTFFWIERSNNNSGNIKYILDIHMSYIIASIIFTLVSLLSTWLIHRRRKTSTMDVHLKTRRNVSSLLQVLNKLEEAHDQADRYPHMAVESAPNDDSNDVKLLGNALSDVYSVYRLSSTKDERAGRWHSIPSLLLVKGDFVALQTGDIAPADCRMVTGSRFASLTQDTKKVGLKKTLSHDTGVIKAGETVKLPLRVRPDQIRNSIQSLSPWFPPGKSTLPENSRKLLHLCSNMRVYEVLETPMIKFLQSDSGA